MEEPISGTPTLPSSLPDGKVIKALGGIDSTGACLINGLYRSSTED